MISNLMLNIKFSSDFDKIYPASKSNLLDNWTTAEAKICKYLEDQNLQGLLGLQKESKGNYSNLKREVQGSCFPSFYKSPSHIMSNMYLLLCGIFGLIIG